MPCSHRDTQGSRVYFTNSNDCCSILEKLLFSRSPTMWGGTRKMRAISLIWNFLVSRNCACSGDVGRILRTFKIKKNVEVTDNGKIII